jgi:hypothetical protein
VGHIPTVRILACVHQLLSSSTSPGRQVLSTQGVPTEKSIQVLAQLLDVDAADIRAAARLSADGLGPYQPPAISTRLSSRQRAALSELIRSMVWTQ